MSRRAASVARVGRASDIDVVITEPAVGDFPTRVAAIDGNVTTWHRHAQASASSITAAVGAAGTGVNTTDLDTQVGDIITDSDGGSSSMAFGASGTASGGYTIPAPFQSATYWAFYRIQLDAIPTTDMVLDTIGQGDNIDGEGAHKIIPDGAGGATVRMEAVGPSGFARKDATSPGLVLAGKSIGVLYQRTSNDMKVFVGDETGDFIEATMAYVVGSAQTWGATPNDTWHVGYFPATGGSLQSNGFNGLMGDRLSGTGVLSNSDITTLMSSTGQTVVAARNVTLPNVTEGEGQITTSIGTSINPEDGSTISLIAPNAAHSTVVVQGQALQVTPGTVSSNQANTQGFRVTHAAGTADAIASYTVLNSSGSPASYLPYLGALYGSVWCNQNHGNDRLRNASPGDGCFFYAMKTGNIVAIQSHERIGSGYSDPAGSGNHGSYTVRIWPANATTRRPITTGSPICQKSTYNATTSASNQYPVITFDSPGAVTAGQPYFLAFARNSGGYYSHNHVWQNSFFHQTDTLTPQNYVEPGGGPGAGSINCASGGVDAENPGSSAARVLGWTPFKVGGVHRVVGRFTTQDGQYDRRCGGCYEVAFVYSDGDVAGFGSFGGGGAGADRTQPGGTSAHRILMTEANNYQVRERFRVTRQNVVVSGVFIRAVRNSTSTGSLRVRLESGPTTETHFPSSNGSLMEEFVVPASLILPVGNVSFETHEQLGSATAALDVVHFVWVPVSGANHTLTVGSQYTVRVYPVGSAQFAIQGSSRSVHVGHSPSGKTRTWAQWEADREVSGECFEDCRDGGEYSTNGGSSWLPLYGSGGDGVYPIVFKRV